VLLEDLKLWRNPDLAPLDSECGFTGLADTILQTASTQETSFGQCPFWNMQIDAIRTLHIEQVRIA
jgi:hypothetical protein